MRNKLVSIKQITEEDDKSEAYKLWYRVYFEEMNRNIKCINNKDKILIDDLEPQSTILIAHYDNKTVGSSRIHINFNKVDSYYYSLYELSSFEGQSYCIVTKYMVDKEYKRTNIAYILALSTVDFCKKNNIKWIIMDCSPAVYEYFEKLGFINHCGIKESPEYGEVKIMKFDVFSKKKVPLHNESYLHKNTKFYI